MRSVEPTDVPPYFWTISAIAAAERAEHERGVGAAKAERIGHRTSDLHLARDKRHEVEIAVWIDVDEVGRRRRDLVAQREHGEHGLDAAGGAQQMSGHRFGRRDGELARVVAEGPLHRRAFREVAERRRR